ncbi:MAG: hypothetical protein NT016_01130 [Candidatus Aenigmarchaeota archaeon]|nr:hypothetical protein [Candidatus Aenigmarchaeota archaeon]
MGTVLSNYINRIRFGFHGVASACYLHGALSRAIEKKDYSSVMSLYAGFAKHFDACVELDSKCGSALPRHCAADFGKDFARGVIDAGYGLLSYEELAEKLSGHEFAKKLEAAGGKCTSCGRECRLELYMEPDPSGFNVIGGADGIC